MDEDLDVDHRKLAAKRFLSPNSSNAEPPAQHPRTGIVESSTNAGSKAIGDPILLENSDSTGGNKTKASTENIMQQLAAMMKIMNTKKIT